MFLNDHSFVSIWSPKNVKSARLSHHYLEKVAWQTERTQLPVFYKCCYNVWRDSNGSVVWRVSIYMKEIVQWLLIKFGRRIVTQLSFALLRMYTNTSRITEAQSVCYMKDHRNWRPGNLVCLSAISERSINRNLDFSLVYTTVYNAHKNYRLLLLLLSVELLSNSY